MPIIFDFGRKKIIRKSVLGADDPTGRDQCLRKE